MLSLHEHAVCCGRYQLTLCIKYVHWFFSISYLGQLGFFFVSDNYFSANFCASFILLPTGVLGGLGHRWFILLSQAATRRTRNVNNALYFIFYGFNFELCELAVKLVRILVLVCFRMVSNAGTSAGRTELYLTT